MSHRGARGFVRDQITIKFPNDDVIVIDNIRPPVSQTVESDKGDSTSMTARPLPLQSAPPVKASMPISTAGYKSRARRKQKIYRISSVSDGIAEGEGDLLFVLDELQKQGCDAVGLAELSRRVRARRRKLPAPPNTVSACGCSKSIRAAEQFRKRQTSGRTTKRSVQNERDSLVRKGYLEFRKPPYSGDVTRYRVRTESEVWEFFRARKWTHWKRAGRGRKLLSLGDAGRDNGDE